MTENNNSHSVDGARSPDAEHLLTNFSPYKDLLASGMLPSLDQYVRKLGIPAERQNWAKQEMSESADYQAALAMVRIADRNYESIDQLIEDLRVIGDRSLKLEGMNGSDGLAATLTGEETAKALVDIKNNWETTKKKYNMHTATGYDDMENYFRNKGITSAHDIRNLAWNLLDHQSQSEAA